MEDKDVDLPGDSNYYDLLATLKINPETVVVFRDGVPVPFDSKVAGDGTIEVMRVVSGG
jgi:sulfur carrier protein